MSELSAEIAVETAMVSANWRKNVPVIPDEGGRNKYRAKYQRDRNQGSTNFGHRLARCVARTQTIFNMMFDCLDNHYGVVDHDANGEDDSEKGKLID